MRAWPLLLVAALGCDRKNPHGEMKPADSWEDPDAPGAEDVGGLAPPMAPMDDPHGGGLPPGHPPLPGMDEGGRGDEALAPDPDRPIDSSKYLRGGIVLGAGATLPASGVVFLAVRVAGPDGKPVPNSPPLAVDIVEGIPEFPFGFDLHEGKQMMVGTTFDGDVLVVARIDQDGDADTQQPGDLYGLARARIPQGDLLVSLEPLGQ